MKEQAKTQRGASTRHTDGLTIGLAHQNEFDDVDAGVKNIKDGDTQRIGLLGVNYTNDGLVCWLHLQPRS